MILATAALAGCGFSPVYGPAGAGGRLQGRIAFASPGTEAAYDLVAALEDRLGRAEGARYRMDYVIATQSFDLGITTQREITRYNVTGAVQVTVADLATGTTVFADTVEAFTSYSATGTAVSTEAAEADASRRLMTILADRIVTRLYAEAEAWPA